MSDPYKVLGVSPDATDEQIKQAYRRLAKKYHPDLNPGDEAAAEKMQQINAAYEQIKNPEKATQSNPYGGYDPYGGYGRQSYEEEGDPYLKAAAQYIRFGSYREALNTLENSKNRDGRWYYLSAVANNGLGNQVTALEHIRRAVSMEPDNMEYLAYLRHMEQGGQTYRRHAGGQGGFSMGFDPCRSLCLCYLMRMICCC